ncbi:M16 family metallopeptidase [Polymorphum gilvum]|uniref:Peptidase M16-like protein n=1 Tax=Polymorphum gilvum (strain LMG 25793 / CGMCC 1.9160 / SL003B-26A1) TaxID=991905 RepID=F2J036_POLGS|nr:pitrilysin family protein [Polymorphum gilvum]ADZ71871.1 Peptidase M16-like protein [Polymorphum gilvum SL003B-26A1]
MTMQTRPGALLRLSMTGSLTGLAALLLLALTGLAAQATAIQRIVSPGGIEAWLVEDHTVPLIALNFSFEGGSTQDPDGKEGVTRLLAATLDEGAGELTSEAFQARLEELAVSISFNAGMDRFYGSLRSLTDTGEDAFDLLHLALSAPRFDEDAVDRMKSQIVSGLKRETRDPDAIASKAFMRAAFPDHPYARPSNGTETSVPALTRDDLVAQHRRLVARKGLTIGVVGAIDADTLSVLLDRTFAGLPEQGDLVPVAETQPETGIRVDETLDVPQTTVLLGLPGPKRDDPDYQSAFVMNHILGGGSFTSWLYREVREKRGLSYSVGTDLSPYDRSGVLFASGATRADRASETLDIILQQFERMAADGPTPEDLAKAKSFLTGSYALRFDTSGKIAGQLVALQNAGLGIDYFDRRNAEIEAVTLEDVKRVAQRYLAGKTPTVVTVGPATN